VPKDFFSIDRVTSLKTIPPGAKIHVIGVCGVAMAQLSVVLSERGYEVSGSDKEFYEPMGTLLRSSKVRTMTGYDAANVPLDAAIVVIGNAISYGNPEVDIVERENLPYTCFPKLLQETAISGKHSIVITGTHGKSTTTAMIATLLIKQDKDPSYFVGGITKGLPQSLAVGNGNFSVVEGDEYDSAFFAKVPKFAFYTPNTVVVNAIEYDHADIYPNVEAIESEFRKLVTNLSEKDTAICCVDFERVAALVAEWKKNARAKIVTFGSSDKADYRIVNRVASGMTQDVTILCPDGNTISLSLPMVGEYNARNALASLIVAKTIGLDVVRTAKVLGEFERVKRRQEVRCQRGGVVLIEDFAHHPTAVRQTIEGVREAFPNARVWAVFEPRSNTSRRKVFQQEYIQAFRQADRVVLKHVTARAIDQGVELLDVAVLSDQITESGVQSSCLPNVDDIKSHLFSQLLFDTAKPEAREVVVVMSNGSFDGLNETLQRELEGR